MTIKYYRLKRILEYKARYNMIFGMRSNGKTYAVLEHIMQDYLKRGRNGAYLRRWDIDVRGTRIKRLTDAFTNDKILKLSKGKWNGIKYYNREFFFKFTDENGKDKIDTIPFLMCFSLSAMEHDKGNAYPILGTILFDEFIARPNALGGNGYLVDEFIFFTNTLSTLIRDKEDVKIFMLGNTISKFCPYFSEFGIADKIPKMEQGDINIFKFGDSNVSLAVEYCTDKSGHIRKSNEQYFAFDNSKLKMITGGEWELNVYPHISSHILNRDIVFEFFVKLNSHIIHGKIVDRGEEEFPFVFFHPKTTPIKDEKQDIIFCLDVSPDINKRIWLDKGIDDLTTLIADCYNKRRFFYSDNSTGDIIENYIIESRKI